jgi:hypothetical protein
MTTSIDLPEADYALLDSACRQRGISPTEGLKQALRCWLAQPDHAAHSEVFGLWKNREKSSLAIERDLRSEWDR